MFIYLFGASNNMMIKLLCILLNKHKIVKDRRIITETRDFIHAHCSRCDQLLILENGRIIEISERS